MLTDTNTQPTILVLARPLMVKAIARIREDWEQEDESLVDIEASVGMMLADVVEALGFSEEERISALGPSLYNDIQQLMEVTYSIKSIQ